MSLREIVIVETWVTCDNPHCGAEALAEGSEVPFNTFGEVGWTEENGKHYCPKCSGNEGVSK